jgi:integrase
MASIETAERKGKTGNKAAVSYHVRWRRGGGRSGIPEVETFRDEKEAQFFRAAVNRAGNQYPENFIPKVGWVEPDVYRAFLADVDDAEREAEAPPEPEKLGAFARRFVLSMTKVGRGGKKKYLRIITLHIDPWWGALSVDDEAALNQIGIGTWINDLGDGRPPATLIGEDPHPNRRRLKPKTIRNVHGLFFMVVQAALEMKLRADNPCTKTKLPDVDDGEGDWEMTFLTPEEYGLVRREMRADALPLTDLLAGTGARYSEVTGFRKRDFSRDKDGRPWLHVRKAWKNEGGSWVLGKPKTRRSRRGVVLTVAQGSLVDSLTADKKDDDLIVSNRRGERWIHQTYYTQCWRPAVYRAVRCERHREQDLAAGIGRRGFRYLLSEHIVPCGCPGTLTKVPRIHDMRHSHVSWLIAKKVTLKAIQDRLGHRSIQTTMDRYGHLLAEVDDDVQAAVEVMMERAAAEQLPAAA